MQTAIDGKRLWDSLMRLATVGATAKGGVSRLALTDLDREGRDLVCGWLRDAGCTVSVDRIGNVFGRRSGKRSELPPVVAGSHIDTQPSGGKFDGNYGVLAALEVVRTLNDSNIQTERSLEVAIWTNEEGTRFTPVMMGSGVFAGAFSLDHALAQKDLAGKSVGEELHRIGYAGSEPAGKPIEAYFEAHIEQGPVLEDSGNTIGVVTGALGLRWYDVTLEGQDAHAGPTPMQLRKDAALGAANVITAVNRIALAHQPQGRGTVGFVDVKPNSRNVVAGLARLSVDLRHSDLPGLEAMESELRAACAEIANAHGLKLGLQCVTNYAPLSFDGMLVDGVRKHARELGYKHMDIVSGAGHDACYVARTAPTAMIFVPCEGGISHNEIESADPGDLAAGANVLLMSMLDRLGHARQA